MSPGRATWSRSDESDLRPLTGRGWSVYVDGYWAIAIKTVFVSFRANEDDLRLP